MDFITGLPNIRKQHDYIMVMVDKLSKRTHFIPIKSTFKSINITKISMREIFRLHGIPKVVISHRDAKFTSKFWKGLFENMGRNLNFSTCYHPKTDGQIEMTNHILEDMLRMYVKDKQTKGVDYLGLVEFSYNNGYQTSLKMIPFEVMYGRRCKVPLRCEHLEDILSLRPDMLKEMEEVVKHVKHNLKTTRYC